MSSSRQRMFTWSLALVSILLLSAVFVSGSSNAAAPPRSTEPGARATVGALQTQIADAEGTIAVLSAESTIESLRDQIATKDVMLATSQAQASSAQSTSEDLEQQQIVSQGTAGALQQQVAASSLNPSSVEETIQVDLSEVLANNASAISDAKGELARVFAKYVNGESCQIGFVLISSRAQELGQGVQLSDAIARLIQSGFPQLIPRQATGGPGQLIGESIALPGTTPVGEVQLQLFFNTGCQPAT